MGPTCQLEQVELLFGTLCISRGPFRRPRMYRTPNYPSVAEEDSKKIKHTVNPRLEVDLVLFQILNFLNWY